MIDGQECWAWSTRNPDQRIGTVELWGTFDLDNIFLEKTIYDKRYSDHYYETKKQALDAMISRVTTLMMKS